MTVGKPETLKMAPKPKMLMKEKQVSGKYREILMTIQKVKSLIASQFLNHVVAYQKWKNVYAK